MIEISESIANSLDWIDQITYLLQVDFGSESQSRMPAWLLHDIFQKVAFKVDFTRL